MQMSRLDKAKWMVRSTVFNIFLQWWRQSKTFRIICLHLIDFPDKIERFHRKPLWPPSNKDTKDDEK